MQLDVCESLDTQEEKWFLFLDEMADLIHFASYNWI